MSKICPFMAIAANSCHPDVQPWINDPWCKETDCAWWTGKQCGVVPKFDSSVPETDSATTKSPELENKSEAKLEPIAEFKTVAEVIITDSQIVVVAESVKTAETKPKFEFTLKEYRRVVPGRGI